MISHRPYVIGIAGGTASGKTTMTNTIVRTVGPSRVVIIAYDSYYKDLSHVPLAERLLTTNFDHPDSLDTPLLAEHLRQLRRGEAVETPTYDFVTCTRLAATRLVEPCDVIIVDGILALASEELRGLYDLKIFVDLSADERLLRRIERDVRERQRTIESVIAQYRQTVRPMHDQFVEPSKRFADFIVSGETTQSHALETVAGHVRARILSARLDALQQIGAALLAADPTTVKNDIVRLAAQELLADTVTLHQYDAGRGEFLAPATFSASWPPGGEMALPRRQGLSAYVIAHGTVVVPDATNDLPPDLVQTAHFRASGTQAFVGMRLQQGETPVGVLFFNFRSPRAFGPDDVAIAGILATYAAAAIARGRQSAPGG
ncbi:uridine kinase [Candidatus Amarolinea dominans]|uniref:uridine kinase n=1 Tax=Candidatus Amarolinea dominans TaxID=3140696 RepID=UPI001DE520C3|nr:uridine kinase [Anaerolineae bacterium]